MTEGKGRRVIVAALEVGIFYTFVVQYWRVDVEVAISIGILVCPMLEGGSGSSSKCRNISVPNIGGCKWK